MKFLIVLFLGLFSLMGCQKKDPVTTCTMQYSCYSNNVGYFNASCVSQYGTSTHSGGFTNSDQGTAEAECVAWQYAFINGYGSTYYPYAHPTVTQCSCSTN